MSSPWHLVLGAVTAIGARRAAPRRRHRQLLAALILGALVETTPDVRSALGVGGLLGLLMAWGVRAVPASGAAPAASCAVSPTPTAVRALLGVIALIGIALLVWGLVGGSAPSWAPVGPPSNWTTAPDPRGGDGLGGAVSPRHTVGNGVVPPFPMTYTRTGVYAVATMALATACSKATTPKPTPTPRRPARHPPHADTDPDTRRGWRGPRVGATDPGALPGPGGRGRGRDGGEWKGEQVAVVSFGDDVTLAVRKDAWRIVGGWWPSVGAPDPQLGASRASWPSSARMPDPARTWRAAAATRSTSWASTATAAAGCSGWRDIWAPMPGGGSAKLNAALARAASQGMVETLGALTGVPIEGMP